MGQRQAATPGWQPLLIGMQRPMTIGKADNAGVEQPNPARMLAALLSGKPDGLKLEMMKTLEEKKFGRKMNFQFRNLV